MDTKRPLRPLVAGACLGAGILMAGCSSSGSTAATSTTATTAAATTSAPSTTVGNAASPASVSVVAALPKGTKDPKNWGEQIVAAATKPGDPLVVFNHRDLNNDGKAGDDALLWTVYDHVAKTWSTPKELAKGSFEDDGNERSLSVAVDQTSNLWAVAYTKQDSDGNATGIHVLWSSDQGGSWKDTTVVTKDGTTSPSIALGTKTVAVAYVDNGSPELATSSVPTAGATSMAAFKAVAVPGKGSVTSGSRPPAVAVGTDDVPVVLYISNSTDAGGNELLSWRKGGTPTMLLDTGKVSTMDPQVGLTTSGDTMLAVTSLTTSEADSAPVLQVVTSTDAGTTWNQPVGVKADDATNPFSVVPALAGDGHALVAYAANSSGGGQQCFGVKVATSDDLSSWKPCSSPDGFMPPGTATAMGYYPATSRGSAGSLWTFFQLGVDADGNGGGIAGWQLPGTSSATTTSTASAAP